MSSIPGMVAPGDLGRTEGLGVDFVHLDQVVWAGFVGAAAGTQHSTLEIRMSGERCMWDLHKVMPIPRGSFQRFPALLRGITAHSGAESGTHGQDAAPSQGFVDERCLWGFWLGVWFVPSVVGDSLHQDHSSPGLAPRSHPREHIGLELCQPLGNPLPQRWPLPYSYSLGLHLLLAGDREPVG